MPSMPALQLQRRKLLREFIGRWARQEAHSHRHQSTPASCDRKEKCRMNESTTTDEARRYAWAVYEREPIYRRVAIHRGLSVSELRQLVNFADENKYDVEAVCPRCERSLFDCYSLTVAHPDTGYRPPLAYHRCLPQVEARKLESEYFEHGFRGTILHSEVPPSPEDCCDFGPACPACGSRGCRPGGSIMCGARGEWLPGEWPGEEPPFWWRERIAGSGRTARQRERRARLA
jgi:hypothetical protein